MLAEATRERAMTAGATQPYPGLRPFRPDEWSIFCGRELIVEEVIDRVATRNVVLIHGGSGSGKSSLVAAGVLPTLEREYDLAGVKLASAIIRPSEGPYHALATALAEQLGAPDDEPDAQSWWSRALMFAPDVPRGKQEQAFDLPKIVLKPIIKDAAKSVPVTAAPEPVRGLDIVKLAEQRIEARGLEAFCLIVDQFEEIFPWARDRRRSDVELLAHFLGQVAAGKRGRRLFVLVTMRSDYLGSCAQFPALSALINDCQYFLPAMTDRGIARAIAEPAEIFGGSVRPELTERLLMQAATGSDPLPLLQHALMRMAERHAPLNQGAWELTLEDLTAVEGASNALSAHADELYAEYLRSPSGLTSEARAVGLEWLFRALFEVDVRGAAVRRPRDFAELVAVSGLPEAEVEKVVEIFSREGSNLLVVRPSTEGAGRRRVDISHEALLRNWGRMLGPTGWIQREFDDGLVWRMLATTARAEHAKLDAGLLAQVRPSWRAIADAPERACRYLLDNSGKPAMEDKPEWIRVAGLIRRSERAIRLKRWLGIALLVMVLVVFAGVTLWLGQGDARFARTDADIVRESAVIRERADQRAIEILTQDAAEDTAGERETALTFEQVTTADTVAQAIDGAERTRGYIWIGDRSDTNLRQPDSGARVPVSAVTRGESYQVRQNLALRSGTPAPGNRSAPRIGAVRRGTIVRALDTPQFVEGQFWLSVEPELTHTVYVQYGGGDAPLTRVVERLRNLGYIVPAPERLDSARGTNEVRYCHESDAGKAGELARELGVELRYIGASGRCEEITREGTIELWVDSLERVAR